MAAMKKIEKPSPTELPLLFEIDPEPAQEVLTAWGGVPLVVQTLRSLGMPASVKQHVRIKERQRGFDEATFVESLVILNAVGGECADDFQRLREDAGLPELIGHEVPSPSVARTFLNAFHEDEKIEEAKKRRGPEQIAFIPEENEPLEGLGLVNREFIHRLGERCPDQQIATVDQDATIIESRKREALPPEVLTARPKRLRFLYLNIPGRLVHHARKLILRLAISVERLAACMEGWRLPPISP